MIDPINAVVWIAAGLCPVPYHYAAGAAWLLINGLAAALGIHHWGALSDILLALIFSGIWVSLAVAGVRAIKSVVRKSRQQ
jgi:hypothetical protein